MTIRKWSYLFWSTLGWGTLAGLIAGVFLISTNHDFSFLEVKDAGFNSETFMFMILGGALISVLSQMGFFSYLIVRYIAIGLIRNKGTWDLLQVILIVITFFELTYLRYISFGQSGATWFSYLYLPLVLLVISLGVAYWKVKQTHWSGFVPTLFFMFVVTILEATPALKLSSFASYVFMFFPLLVSNAWQIMLLHKLLPKLGAR